MTVPDFDKLRHDVTHPPAARKIRPVPHPFRIAQLPDPLHNRYRIDKRDVIDELVMDLKKFPFFLRFTLLFGSAASLWMLIFDITSRLLR